MVFVKDYGVSHFFYKVQQLYRICVKLYWNVVRENLSYLKKVQ